MSYADQVMLRTDSSLQSRTSVSVFEQATVYTNDGRPDIAALADRHLRDAAGVLMIWMPFIAAAPGFADRTEDTSQITDGDLLAAVQGMWPKVASVYYAPDGTPVS